MSDNQPRPAARLEPNVVMAEPTTVGDCMDDYNAGSATRHVADVVARRQYGER